MHSGFVVHTVSFRVINCKLQNCNWRPTLRHSQRQSRNIFMAFIIRPVCRDGSSSSNKLCHQEFHFLTGPSEILVPVSQFVTPSVCQWQSEASFWYGRLTYLLPGWARGTSFGQRWMDGLDGSEMKSWRSQPNLMGFLRGNGNARIAVPPEPQVSSGFNHT